MSSFRSLTSGNTKSREHDMPNVTKKCCLNKCLITLLIHDLSITSLILNKVLADGCMP